MNVGRLLGAVAPDFARVTLDVLRSSESRDLGAAAEALARMAKGQPLHDADRLVLGRVAVVVLEHATNAIRKSEGGAE